MLGVLWKNNQFSSCDEHIEGCLWAKARTVLEFLAEVQEQVPERNPNSGPNPSPPPPKEIPVYHHDMYIWLLYTYILIILQCLHIHVYSYDITIFYNHYCISFNLINILFFNKLLHFYRTNLNVVWMSN